MRINFSKYQGTGNDFIMLDNRSGLYDSLSIPQIKHLCDRKFGIGSDGLIKINSDLNTDFEVDYYNSDGSKSFCGNGARCAVAFASSLGIDVSNTTFDAFDGLHEASLEAGIVSLKMNDVSDVEIIGFDYQIYTGSPHYIHFLEGSKRDVVEYGRSIRYGEKYEVEGINVNTVQVFEKNHLVVETYERGVEDETLSCGTGVTACAIAYAIKEGLKGIQEVQTQVKGGQLSVRFNRVSEFVFDEVCLIGPATFVFKGELDV
jgi:diaminopimelate epimerase